MTHRALILAASVAAAAFASVGASNTLWLHQLPESGRGKCLDGSAGGFYWRHGDPDRFLVVLNGGGWCYTLQDCYDRSHTALGSSTKWTKTIEGDGISDGDLEGNPFANFSVAYLYYCDGASFASDRVDPVPYNSSTSLMFRGRAMLDEALDMLFDPSQEFRMDQASMVLLGGHSAGGMATFHAADHVAERVTQSAKPGATFLALPDAGFFLPTVPDVTGNFSFRAKMQSIYALSNASAGVHPDCYAHYHATGEDWKCMFPLYETPFIQSLLFLSQSQYDMWQLGEVLRLTCDPAKEGACSATDMRLFQGFKQYMMQGLKDAGVLSPAIAHRAGVSRLSRSIFADACIAHSQDYYGNYFTNRDWMVDNQTIAETMAAWVFGSETLMPVAVDAVDWPLNKPCAAAGCSYCH